jgi:hypothetical protein
MMPQQPTQGHGLKRLCRGQVLHKAKEEREGKRVRKSEGGLAAKAHVIANQNPPSSINSKRDALFLKW